MRRTVLLACLFCVWGAAQAADLVLAPQSMGPLRIGDSVSKAEREVRQKLPYNLFANAGCAIFPIRELPGVSIIFYEKRVSRVDVEYYGKAETPQLIRTAEGIGLGSSEEDVMRVYGARVRIEPDKSDPNWHYLYVDEPDRLHGLAFYTDGKKVKSMRGGEYPALAHWLGCN